jgi:hypothetical protein
MTVFQLKYWDQKFESHSRPGCMCVFPLCLCCSAQKAAVRRTVPPVERSLPTVHMIQISVLITSDWEQTNRLRGIVVRVLVYRIRDPRFDSRRHQIF